MKVSLKDSLICALFVALMAVSSYIRIPIPGYGVPFTMQVLIVLASSMSQRPGYALATQCIFLVMGLTGIPVFGANSGIGAILSPTFGFLVGFVIAAPFIALIIQKSSGKLIHYLFAGSIGLCILYAFGVTYLWWYTNALSGKAISLGAAVVGGCLVFLPLDIIKLVLAAVIARRINKQRKLLI
ncbi:MAG: biotin transporter BioY [Christensenellales bacterium]